MNPSMLMPFILIASAKKSNRKRLAEALLPAMFPVPATHQVALSAVMADMQVRREDRRVKALQAEEEEHRLALVREAAAVGDKILSSKAPIPFSEFKTEAPKLAEILEKFPELQKKFVKQ